MYVAIDESYSDKLGIFVAAFSKHPLDIWASGEKLRKSRSKGASAQRMLAVADYRFVLIKEGFLTLSGDAQVETAVTSLVRACGDDLSMLLLDGSTSTQLLRTLEGYLEGIPIHFAPRGDQWYPLLNRADAIAYQLNRASKRKNGLSPYEEKRVEAYGPHPLSKILPA